MRFRLFFLLGGIMLFLWGCGVPADYSGHASGTGIGGTGALAERKTGIGGTGALSREGTGIGGTGMIAGENGDRLGILGRITGFGSIWVNGLEIEYDQNTPVAAYDSEIGVFPLAEGQVVEVVAENDGGVVRAESIAVRYEIIGPVQTVSMDRRQMRVLEQKILLASDTVLPETWTVPDAENRVVRVSGFRDGHGNILASRVEYGSPGDPVTLIGRVGETSGRTTVSGLPVQLAGDTSPVDVGDMVRVSGGLSDGVLVAHSLRPEPADLFTSEVDRFLIQAVARSRDADGSISLGGMLCRLQGDGLMADLPDNRPLLFMGTMMPEEGFRLQRIAPSPSMPGHSLPRPSMNHGAVERHDSGRPSTPFSRPGRSMGGHGGRMGR